MSAYHIIDEPKLGRAQQLVVNPSLILLSAVLIPLMLTIPFHGQFWMPFVWLVVNGYLLGSPTFWKECVYAGMGLIVIVLAFVGFGYGIKTELIGSPNMAAPYLRVVVNALYFIALYFVVFTQSAPYAVFQYVKQQGQHE